MTDDPIRVGIARDTDQPVPLADETERALSRAHQAILSDSMPRVVFSALLTVLRLLHRRLVTLEARNVS